MYIEKEKIKRVIFENKQKEDKVLENILYEILIEYNQKQNIDFKTTLNNVATKDDIKMVIEMMDKRFEAVDKRFEAVDKRFEDMYKYMDKRFSSLQWFIGIAFVIISVLMTMLKIFG